VQFYLVASGADPRWQRCHGREPIDKPRIELDEIIAVVRPFPHDAHVTGERGGDGRIGLMAMWIKVELSGLGEMVRHIPFLLIHSAPAVARRLGFRETWLSRAQKPSRPILAKALKTRNPWERTLKTYNRMVEIDKISGQKTAKVRINHLTILIQHGWLHLASAGWSHLARQVYSKYLITCEASLRPGA
jgi:hypothetical protein